eukprot:s1106_g9.t1
MSGCAMFIGLTNCGDAVGCRALCTVEFMGLLWDYSYQVLNMVVCVFLLVTKSLGKVLAPSICVMQLWQLAVVYGGNFRSNERILRTIQGWSASVALLSPVDNIWCGIARKLHI